MITWDAFSYKGITYDLGHLHPFCFQYKQQATVNKPESIFNVQLCFSLHCFTKDGLLSSSSPLNYSDAKETRTFNFDRYELSKKLPEIVMSLHMRKCMHTTRGNYFVIDVDTPDAGKLEYEVFFNVGKLENNVASIYIESAYVRDEAHMKNRPPTTKKISLFVLIYNKLNNKIIRVPT